MKFTRIGVIAAATLVGVSGATAEEFEAESPQCIAPSNPGGGWDFICRTTAKYLFDLGVIEDSMQVTNMSGGGGGVAFAHVTQERNDDNNLIVAASMSTSARIAQGIYEGAVQDDVHFLATFGAEYGAIAVRADSPFQTLADMMDAILEDPRSVGIAGGSSVGSFDHIKPMLVAREAGMDDVTQLKYVSFDGGGEAMTGLLSGATEALSGDFSEMLGFLESGDIRIIGIMAPERLANYPDIPTARELGYDVVGANWRGLYMPAGASDEAKEFWTDAIKTMVADPSFQETLEAAAIAPFNNFDEDMYNFVAGSIADVEKLSREIGIIE
ncbi:Bug family tripartite tricarboxylate transporter substrate binding protein [Aestuariibius sp. HNIBRBA575]|uniref:Bug family tripartite tricarboxylate transporter substrate binding protein n=1 Tax=Aestuariibius sp. HNIBRBA575 TaxID=3233343 RepID=UPI0034A5AA25